MRRRVGAWILRPVGSYEIPVYRPEHRKWLFWTSSSAPVFSVAVNPRSECIVLLLARMHSRLMHCARVSDRLSVCYGERSCFNCYAIPERDRYRHCAYESWWIFVFRPATVRMVRTIRREYTLQIRMRQDPKINSTGLTSFGMLSWHVPDVHEWD